MCEAVSEFWLRDPRGQRAGRRTQLPVGHRLRQILGYVLSRALSACFYSHHRSQEHPSTEDRQPAYILGVTVAVGHTIQVPSSGYYTYQNHWKSSSTLGSQCSRGHWGREGPVRAGPCRDLGLARYSYQSPSGHLADLSHAKLLLKRV